MNPARKRLPYCDSLRRLSEALPYIVDERVGIVKEVTELPRDAGAPDYFHFYAQAANTSAFTRQLNFYAAGGASGDRGMAVAKAVGEAVERYCGAIYDVEELPLFSRQEAPFRCVDPALFAHYSAEQYGAPGFPYVEFDDATPVRWVAARDVLTWEEIYVPAAKVYVPYTYYEGTGDTPICQPISTGLACHVSPAEAALSGVSEVIERDSVTLMWQAMITPPQVSVETLSDANYDLVERYERTGGKVTMFDITTDNGVPTILSVVRYESLEQPGLVVAASTSLDPEEAARKSLEELAHTRRYSQQINLKLPRLVVDAPLHENVSGQISHLNFWCDHDNLRYAAFLFSSKKRIGFDEIPNRSTGDARCDFAFVARAIEATGHRVLLVDVTTPDVRGLGFTVIRAIVPGYHPLALGFAYRARGGRRLYEVPQKLGHKGITREAGENPIPHPYP
jgi:ribosomal protein S12 methylthiotransferase accessory factor